MRRKWIISAAALSSLVLAVIVWQTSGQPNAGKGVKGGALPIRQVVLFNSGVGYIQREGEVEGNAHIDLTFPVNDINDLLRSMVLQDSSGRVGAINYDSHDPIDKVLSSFAVDLNNNPTLSQILNQARDEKVEIVRPASGGLPAEKPVRLTGTIVGMEVHKQLAGKDNLIDVDYLNLAGDNGLQSISMKQVQSVRFLNPVLDSELQRALRVVASSHDTQKKSVSLSFTGQGKRTVKVGYVVEHPIWKTSYRLQMDAKGKVALQGWAIVENTSDDDWNDVRMTLVSGRPISFKMDLYQPLYVPRPTVEPELFASLRPQVYGGALEDAKESKKIVQELQKNIQEEESERRAGKGKKEPREGAMLKFDEYSRRLGEFKGKDKGPMGGEKLPGINFREGVVSLAYASEIGEYYQYTVKHNITLPRQKSAMLPIIDQMIAGSKVSIYNESVQPKFPLLGLRLKNTSGQPLNQGPITVYEDGTYAGDTRILDLNANEERLLSYALDQSVEIKSDIKSTVSPDMHLRIGEATLTANYSMRQTRTYTIKNRAAKERTVLLEHPIRSGWKLVEPKKPLETTRDLYRFEVKVAPDTSVTFNVVEDEARSDQLAVPGTQPSYLADTGVTIKALSHVRPEKLLALKISKGLLLPTLKSRESRTYFIQNNSEIARNFTIDHIIRAGWVRLTEQGEAQRGPEVFHFDLAVAKGKTASREVVEERTVQQKGALVSTQSEEALRSYLANPVPSADVKAALTKVLAMNARIAETAGKLHEEEKQLKQLTDDQGRLRENLKIIPQSAEPYKKFLDKFVSQESAIEAYQKQTRQLQAALDQQQRERDVFIAALSVE